MKDKEEMEQDLAAVPNLDWVVVRTATLTDDEPASDVRVFTDEADGKAHKIARADVAAFMLEQLASKKYLALEDDDRHRVGRSTASFFKSFAGPPAHR